MGGVGAPRAPIAPRHRVRAKHRFYFSVFVSTVELILDRKEAGKFELLFSLFFQDLSEIDR